MLDIFESHWGANPHPPTASRGISVEQMMDEGYQRARSYVSKVQEGLRDTALVRPSIERTPEGFYNVAMSFHQGEKQVGWANRVIKNNVFEVDKIRLKGKTGILKPLYKAESEHLMENNYRVKGLFANPITRNKFLESYPGSQLMGDGMTGVWTPTLGGKAGEAFAKPASAAASHLMPEMKAVRSGSSYAETAKIAMAATGNTAKRSVMGSKSMIGALVSGLKGAR